ncbi:hypothetical protein BGZ51_005125 [Haplosporangium sp. Z 767]|nr:hypothetical protein BGZ51_005125 [Haplosporangium sp. Z 767]KAF9182184.1 hypothetical protein BGZ50_005088 [Haplosporangium sp. Z 11]
MAARLSFLFSTTRFHQSNHQPTAQTLWSSPKTIFIHLVIAWTFISVLLAQVQTSVAISFKNNTEVESLPTEPVQHRQSQQSTTPIKNNPSLASAHIDPFHSPTDDYGDYNASAYRPPGMTEEEFQETLYGAPNTLKIGVLLPFTYDERYIYRKYVTRLSLSQVLRMAVKDMNDQQIIPGMNISLIVRDSEQLIPGMNWSGGASAISATMRLLTLGVGSVIGDITSDLTAAEALLTSSAGVPQCSYASYNMDINELANFMYLFRTVPGVLTYLEALGEVILHFQWKRISILHTSDVPGVLGEKMLSNMKNMDGVDMVKVAIPMPDEETQLPALTRNALRALIDTNTRIHILVASRPHQIMILDMIRTMGLFQKNHVWLTTIDLSDSIARLREPSDFNGLIMADAMWSMPKVPAFDRFLAKWVSLDREKYPATGNIQLTSHETFAYTCVQVIAEAYRDLVRDAQAITNDTIRQQLLRDIMQGKRSKDMTVTYLGQRSYDSPIGNFSVSRIGNPVNSRIAIATFQDTTSVENGVVINGKLTMVKPVQFKDGTTNIPLDAPSWEELKPDRHSAFVITMIALSCILLLAIIITAIIVVVNRENIIVKSARIGMMPLILGLTINLSALVVKNYRIYRIFNSISVINHAVSNKYLLRVVTVPVAITLIPLVIHCFVKYLKPAMVRTNNNEFWVRCTSEDTQIVWTIIIGAAPVLLNAFGIYLAFKTRNVTRLWNEARSIAITIYLVSFFVIIIIIVQAFPGSLYWITYHVTIMCVFLTSFIEYLILFYPKLRNLWLQKQGLHVAAGREEVIMDSILGGISASIGRHGDINAPGAQDFSADRFLRSGEKTYGSSAAAAVPESDHVSVASVDLQRKPKISDLISSYPLGQIGDDYSTASVVSPAQCPTACGSSNLTSGARKSGENEQAIETLELTEARHFPNGSIRRPESVQRPAAEATGALNPKLGWYDSFGRDSQPTDLHEVQVTPFNQSRDFTSDDGGGYSGGMLSVSKPHARPSPPMDIFNSASDRYSNSRKSSVGDFDHPGLGRPRSIMPLNKSPKSFPLQPMNTLNTPYTITGGHGSLRSRKYPLRETRMDSYTITVPVQRQRWYIMRVLTQWRMSKIIFVPYSKVLVIVDLATEKSESLILHSIEMGYSSELSENLKDHHRGASSVVIPNCDPISGTVLTTAPMTTKPSTAPLETNTLQSSTSAAVPVTRRTSRSDEVASSPSEHTTANSMQPQPPLLSSVSEPAEAESKPRLLQMASSSRLNNVKHMSFTLGLDERNMDGKDESYGGIDGMEQGIMNDFIVRVISIHNECWRVRLPDQETMDRWIEIGQHIKDENWIARSPMMPTRGNKIAAGLTKSGRSGGVEGPSSNSGEEDGDPRCESDQFGYRPRELSRMPHMSNDSYFTQPVVNSNTQAEREDHMIYTDLTDTSCSSNETERQRSRQMAARMNQHMRASKYAPLRGLIIANSLGIKSRSQSNSNNPSRSNSPFMKKHRPSSTSGPRSIPTALSPNGVSDSNHELSSAKEPLNVRMAQELSPEHKKQDQGSEVDSLAIPRTSMEQANIRDILAETNVAYDQGQHAIYNDNEPGHEHRGYRFFNNLQYNYGRSRSVGDEVNLFPQSPEWHLTSEELEKMEADHIKTIRSASEGDITRAPASLDKLSPKRVEQPIPPTSSPVDTGSHDNISATSASLKRSNSLRINTRHPQIPELSITVDTPSRPLYYLEKAIPANVLEPATIGAKVEQTAGKMDVSASIQTSSPTEMVNRKQPLFPPRFARYQTLSPTTVHLSSPTVSKLDSNDPATMNASGGGGGGGG